MLLLKNGAGVFQGNKLGLTPVNSTAAKDNYKALQVALLLPSQVLNNTTVANWHYCVSLLCKSLLLHEQDCVDIL